jgi:geranylgeranyl diphosphate synthase type II
MGGTLADGSSQDIEHLKAYGTSIGLAFQITDDILDVKGSSEELGKKTGSDCNKGKATYPRILGIDQAEERKRELYHEALTALQSFDKKADHLREIGLYIIERHC